MAKFSSLFQRAALNVLRCFIFLKTCSTRYSFSNIALSTETLDPLTTGFMITGNAANDYFGYKVSTAGDINNDGYDDIIVGAPSKSSGQGAAYVIYGGPKSSMSNIYLSTQTLDPHTTGFMITGNTVGDYFGYTVSTAGDINNDGYDDVIVGAPYKSSRQGAAYIIYGGPKSTMSNLDLSSTTLNPLTTGFMITGNGVNNYFGISVSKAGDINNDAYADIIVGAYGKSSGQGAAYVIYGGPKSTRLNIPLSSSTLNPLTTGFMITGNAANDQLGYSVSTAGNNNIIVGAYNKNSAQGAVYVISASCSKNCVQCSSQSVCTECQSSYLVYQSECFASCPNATFASTTTTCEACPVHCNHCNSTSICTECISPFVLYESQCLTSCPNTMFNSNNVCKDCPSSCSSCLNEESCQVCSQGYILSNSLCVVPPSSSQQTQEQATQALSSTARGISSVVCVGSVVAPFTALVSKTVQNTRYLNLSVTSDLAEIYQTWGTDLIPWGVPNVMSELDHFETSPYLFSQFDINSPFLVNFWPTLVNIGIGFSTFAACILLKKLFEREKYEGWAYSFVRKLVTGSFNFALVQAYTCLDDILFYLVLDAKTNPFNSFFSWVSMICAAIFLALGCLLVFFNFWTVKKYQAIKNQGANSIEAFNERNKYWELFYSDFNDNDFYTQSFFAILIVRSALSSLIITVLYDYPLMQTSYLVMMDLAIISFLYFQAPFNTLRGKLAQYYYESITLLVHICTFILSLQDPSDTVRLIFSTAIIYLNTALLGGSLGFMFIEIYKIISEKERAAKRKQAQDKCQDETQRLKSSEADPHRNLHRVQQKSNMTSYNLNLESNFNDYNWMYPSQQRDQRRASIACRPLKRRLRRSTRPNNVIYPTLHDL